MNYATSDDLAARVGAALLIALADEDMDSIPDPENLDAAIGDASAEIDATLAARFAVPIDPAPAVLVRVCSAIAIQFLFVRKRDEIGEEHLRAATDARALLAAWAAGRSELPGAIVRQRTESNVRERMRTLDREALEAF